MQEGDLELSVIVKYDEYTSGNESFTLNMELQRGEAVLDRVSKSLSVVVRKPATAPRAGTAGGGRMSRPGTSPGLSSSDSSGVPAVVTAT